MLANRVAVLSERGADRPRVAEVPPRSLKALPDSPTDDDLPSPRIRELVDAADGTPSPWRRRGFELHRQRPAVDYLRAASRGTLDQAKHPDMAKPKALRSLVRRAGRAQLPRPSPTSRCYSRRRRARIREAAEEGKVDEFQGEGHLPRLRALLARREQPSCGEGPAQDPRRQEALAASARARYRAQQLIIADGYHRLCSVYQFDEDAWIPCKIV
jgi:hypothetical protein